MRPGFIIAGIVGAIAIIAVVQFWPQIWPQAEETPAAPPSEAPAAEREPADTEMPPTRPPADRMEDIVDSQPPAPAPEPLPALADSDDWLRAEIAEWALPQILVERDALISRFVVVLANAADGNVPRRQLTFLTPAEAMTVTRIDEERYLLDPVSFTRYDGYLDALEAIPPADLAGFLRRIEPLLATALGQLGERRSVQVLLQAALARLDNLPALPAQIELVRPEVMYLYADPALEVRSDLDKQLLRLGPRNLSRLRSYLIDFNQFYFQG